MHWNLVQGSRLAHVSDILVECSCKRDLIPVFLPLRSMALQMMHCLMRECPHKWWFGARNYCLGQLTWANSLESVFTNKFLVIPNRASCVWFFFLTVVLAAFSLLSLFPFSLNIHIRCPTLGSLVISGSALSVFPCLFLCTFFSCQTGNLLTPILFETLRDIQ